MKSESKKLWKELKEARKKRDEEAKKREEEIAKAEAGELNLNGASKCECVC